MFKQTSNNSEILDQDYFGFSGGLIKRSLSSMGITVNDKVKLLIPELVLTAMEKFDASRGMQLNSWVYQYVAYKTQATIKRQTKSILDNSASLDYEYGSSDDEESESNLYNLITDGKSTEDRVIESMTADKVNHVISLMTGKKQVAMKAYLTAMEEGKENTFKSALGKQFGMSRQGASKVVKIAIEEFKQLFQE